MHRIDTYGEVLDRKIRDEFGKVLSAAWGAFKDSSGNLKTEAMVLIGLLPNLKSLAQHRERYLKKENIA